MLELALVLVVGGILLCAVLTSLYLARQTTPGELVPSAGAEFRSDVEGFTQRVLRVDENLMWVRLTLDPHAVGPPAHVHARFDERFRVAVGTLAVDLPEGTRTIEAGEEILVPAGTPHRVWNPTHEPAVVEGPLEVEYALPLAFGVFLAQAYGYFDERPENGRPPRALLQMSLWSPLFDVWLTGVPVRLQRIVYSLIRPFVLLMGYRPWYPRFAPGATTKS